MSTAIILMTHRFDKAILAEFQRMGQGLQEGDQAFILSDGTASAPISVQSFVHTFDFAKLAPRAARIIGTDVLRNIHLAWVDFFEAHPVYDHYWLIEYDVFYAGAWSEVFDAFRREPHDLLCSHLRPYAQEPGWDWWHEIQAPGKHLQKQDLLRGFLPITRLSRRGFQRLRDAVDEGWTGFFEGLVPTLFLASGLRIGDLGGDGPFVPEGFKDRFYTSGSDPKGCLWDLGTMRFNPPIRYPRIASGRLYHPVKPEALVMDGGIERPEEALAQALEALKAMPLPAQPSPRDRQAQILTGLALSALEESLAQLKAEHSSLATLRVKLQALAKEDHNRTLWVLRCLILRVLRRLVKKVANR